MYGHRLSKNTYINDWLPSKYSNPLKFSSLTNNLTNREHDYTIQNLIKHKFQIMYDWLWLYIESNDEIRGLN